jgi:hypothetical protein
LCREQVLELAQVVERYEEIQVVVWASLAPEERIHAPATRHPAANVMLYKHRVQRQGFMS